jgi:7-cyano-7-deazaguanine synthase in queuosine biosynthesis
MCQIIVREYEKENIKLFEKDIENIQNFEKLLSIKGGNIGSDEGYSVLIIISGVDKFNLSRSQTINYDFNANTFKEIKKDILENFNSLYNIITPYKIIFGLFSRQRPEMEAGDVNISPYFNTLTNKIYFVHGTISNDVELSISIKAPITVDTEIFSFIDENNINRLEGLFSYVEIDLDTLNVKMVDRGMGKYVGEYKGIKTYSTTNIFTKRGRNLAMIPKKKVFKNKTISLKIAFSGGMDSVLNTYKIFSDLEKKLEKLTSYNIETELTYFEYGCNAEDDEIHAANNFLDYLENKNLFRSLNINLYRENISGIINNISEVAGEKSKLLDKEAVGNKAEAEDTLAYVPFRNTLMTQILVAQSQKEFDTWEAYPKDFLIMVGLGLNLSDGQVYGDNNIAWLEHTENMLKYGGKRFSNVKLLSPYINRTKINMLKEFKEEFGEEVLKELLNISFSCYYPIDGKACGKCGSCLLREEAIIQNITD